MRIRFGLSAALGLSIAFSLTGLGVATTSTEASAATSSGHQSYELMVVGSLSGTGAYVTPEVVPAVEGAFRGVKGVKIITCDDQQTSANALDCEHEAVTDHVAAVIVGANSPVAENESLLTQAGIPAIGVTDATSANSFSVESSAGVYAGIGVGLAKAGCTRLGLLYLDGTQFLSNAIIGGAKWKSVTEAAIPFSAPDLTPSIAKLAEGKVQCIAISVEPNTVIQAMIAIKQDDLKVKVAMISALLDPQVLSALGSQANGIISIEGNVDPASKAPVLATIKKQMQAIQPNAPVTTASILAWASAKLVMDAQASIKGSVTAASMLKALNGLRNASTDGAIPPFSATPLKNPAYKRFFNHFAIDYVIENGRPTPLTSFYDLTSVLDNKSI
jgi:ABC-type branched-subunit amino acid transport system substrate-binding protein